MTKRPLTQTQARERLRALMAGCTPPRPTRDQHGRPREGWDKPDGREQLTHVVRVLRSVLRRRA
jgi:hypothetical protein